PLTDRTTPANAAFSVTLPANTFSDADPGDVLVYTATLANGTPLPAWLAFNAQTRTFSGTPPASAAGTLRLTVIATDRYGLSASSSFGLSITTLSKPPVATPVPNNMAQNAGPSTGSTPSTTAFRIDWQGSAPALAKPADEDWLIDYLATRPAAKTLGELTGLVVKLEG
uniref:putative Ig domain-containing protein n=1 Tax=Propionivibrio sp. TaxID=2212460 RepID=UPI0026215C5F